MTPEEMLTTITRQGDDVEADGSVVRFLYRNVPLMLVFDTNADRMRLISPIAEVQTLEDGVLLQAMEANFHSVLDARYAVSDGIVWSAFIHPLSELSDEFMASAIEQVATAHVTFGGDFSSGALFFGGGAE